MDLKIKKYFIELGPGAGGASDHDDEQGSGSTGGDKLIIDSKFRRETSNFKVNFDMPSTPPEGALLIKYIEKNLKPEELLGAVVTFVNKTTLIAVVTETFVDSPDDEVIAAYELKLNASNVENLFYVPSTGALSLFGAYVEADEGRETTGRVINLAKLEMTMRNVGGRNYPVFSGYETGLTAEDFVGAKLTNDGTYHNISESTTLTTITVEGYTVLLKFSSEGEDLLYNPTTGQFTPPTAGGTT